MPEQQTGWWWLSGTSRVELATREAGPAVVPATMIQLTVKPSRVTTQRHTELPQPAQHSRPGARRIADSGVGLALVGFVRESRPQLLA